MAITLVQSAGATGTGTSLALAFPNPTTAGNTIIVATRYGNTGTFSTADSNSNIYTTDTGQTDEEGDYLTIMYAFAIAGGACTVTASNSASATIRIAVHEFSGISTSDSRVSANSGGVLTTAVSSGNLTPSAPNALLFGAVACNNGSTGTPTIGNMGTGSPGTLAQNVALEKLITFYTSVNTAGSYQANLTLAAADQWVATMCAFKAGSTQFAAGSFAITGGNATLSASTSIADLLAFPGTYNLLGAPASSDFDLIAAVGSYSITGIAAAFSVVFPTQGLSAAAGSYSIAAQNATFTLFIPSHGSFPSVTGEYYFIATLMLEQAGAIIPSQIGYFGTWPITIDWVKSSQVPGTVVAQSPLPGAVGFIPNSPITLKVSDYPISVEYP